ncbi:MAG: hypothetical protein FWJ74_01415 [Gemmatimonadota bacterium]
MRRTLIRIQLLATALAFGLLTACDTGPSEPPAPDLTEVGISLVGAGAAGMSPRDSVGVSPGDTVVAQCMAGGTRLATFDRSVSHENGIIVESTEIFTRFDDCGVSRGESVITANGELLTRSISHLTAEDATWPHGILYWEAYTTGAVTLSDSNGEVRTCEYDYLEVSRPAEGYFSYKGTVCGVRMEREVVIPVSS